MSNIRWKVCGMKDQENINAIADLGPDMMGFIFYPKSPRFIAEKPVFDHHTFSNIEKTGVFVNANVDEIREKVTSYKLSCLQLHGNETPAYCASLNDLNVKLIKVFGIGAQFEFSTLAPYLEHVDLFLFDTQSVQHGGTGKKFNWKLLEDYPYDKPFIVSGGISIDDTEAIRNLYNSQLPIYAIDINSRFELEPGLKDVGLVQQFIQSVKTKNYES